MRILIIDDHALFRAGMALLLARLDQDVEVVEAGCVEDALALARPAPPDFALVLLDVSLQGTTGLQGLRAVQQAFPGSAVVILSALESAEAMREARVKGARGYVVKTGAPDAMLGALREVLGGRTYFPAIEQTEHATAETRLTPRQREILQLLCEGRTNKEIANQLGMSDNTVRSHLMQMFRALGVRTRTEAAVAARRLGLW